MTTIPFEEQKKKPTQEEFDRVRDVVLASELYQSVETAFKTQADAYHAFCAAMSDADRSVAELLQTNGLDPHQLLTHASRAQLDVKQQELAFWFNQAISSVSNQLVFTLMNQELSREEAANGQ